MAAGSMFDARSRHPGPDTLTMHQEFHPVLCLLRRLAAAVVLLSFLTVAGGHRVAAAEDDAPSVREITARRLLDRLEEKEYADMMLAVLDRLSQEQGISAGLKQEIPFRRAVALVLESRTEANTDKRAAQLADARQAIDAFLASKPSLESTVDANIQRGNLLVEQGRLLIRQADRPGADSEAILAKAAPLLGDAVKSFVAAENALYTPGDEKAKQPPGGLLTKLREQIGTLQEEEKTLKENKKPPAGMSSLERGKRIRRLKEEIPRLVEEQDRFRSKLLQVRLLVGTAGFELSRSLEPGSKAWREAIEASSNAFETMYEKYRTLLAGQFARYYQGRNSVSLAFDPPFDPDDKKAAEQREKDIDAALNVLGDLRLLEGGGPIADLRAKAYNLSLQCWLETLPEAEYASFEGVNLDTLKLALPELPDAKLDADWLGFKYRLAVMIKRMDEAAKEAKGSDRNPLLNSAANSIRRLAMQVAKANREFADEARDLLGDLPEAAVDETFATLMDEAGVAITTMQQKKQEAASLSAAGKADESKAAAEEAIKARDGAIAAIRKAVPLATEDEAAAVNRARYLLTFLMYDSGRLEEAATVGEFLARWYPNAAGSEQAAKIAMASWQKLAKNDSPWAADAMRRCGRMAERILETWPDGSSVADAANVAIAAAADAEDAERIVAIFKRMPADSPLRGQVALRAGLSLWKLVTQKRRLEGEGRPSDETLAAWTAAAAAAFDEGLAASKGGDKLAVAAAVSRCQIGMEAGDTQTVAAVLENPAYGPWTVVTAKGGSFSKGPVAEEILRLALRFFIQSEEIPKAEEAMARLEAVAGDATNLTTMYLAMGRDLQEQLEGIVGAGDGEVSEQARARAQKILSGFEAFLDRVAAQDAKVSSRMWVATTYLTLGSGSNAEGSGGIAAVVPKTKADEYLGKAAAVYEKLLENPGDEMAKFEPSIRFKLADVYRQLGRYDEAMGHLDWILGDSKRVNWRDAQIEAARLLQDAGIASENPGEAEEKLSLAISGRRGGPAELWGWGGIANKLSRVAFRGDGDDPKSRQLRDQFFDARLNLAKCRRALAEKSAGSRDAMLDKAERDIAITLRFYPDLGGEVFRERFDKLLKEIQRARGDETAEGLAGLEKNQES